jgi:5-formyltetrahydrofolate cyclo-ligase
VKKAIRKKALTARDTLPPGERTAKSRAIEDRLFALSEFVSAQVILFFASFRSEVDTGPMIRRALLSGKRVVLPKVTGAELVLYEIVDPDADVSPGAWGIPEPHGTRPVMLDEIDLVIVPGAAYDEQGNRVGYGAGFYDKLLRAFRKMTVALAFEAQIVPNIPAELHDIPIKKIVTEKRVIIAHRAEGKANRA